MCEMKILIEGDNSGKLKSFGVLTLTEHALRDRGQGYWLTAPGDHFDSGKEYQRWFWDVRAGFDVRLLVGWHQPDSNIREVIRLSGVRHFALGEKGAGIYRSPINGGDLHINWTIAEIV